MSTLPDVAVAPRDLSGARWSSAVRCARKAVYEAQDAPRSERNDERLSGYQLRGNVWGDYMRRLVFDEYHRAGRRPQAEVEIPWPRDDPIGTGHADIYIPHECRVIEVTTNTGAKVMRHKALQAAGYARNHQKAISASVLVIDPNEGKWREVEVDVSELDDELQEIEDAVYAGVMFDVLPERVCKHDRDAETFFCPFVAWCFRDWERLPAQVLEGGHEAVDALVAARARLKLANEVVEERKEAVREAEEAVRALVPAQDIRIIGAYEVKRYDVGGRRTLAFDEAEAAGIPIPDQLQPFVKQSNGYERVTVKRLS